jgi:hypothetical protein
MRSLPDGGRISLPEKERKAIGDRRSYSREEEGAWVTIALEKQKVRVEAPRELCFEVVSSAGKVIDRISETERVVEFLTDYRGRTVRTVERVVLEPPHLIRYSWLQGPLPSVEEEIAFLTEGPAATEIVYSGEFSPRPGVLGWVYGRLVVKSRFERIVREHLLDGKAIAEKRAARSRRYPSDRLEPEERT